jgi:hypothetical protein
MIIREAGRWKKLADSNAAPLSVRLSKVIGSDRKIFDDVAHLCRPARFWFSPGRSRR